MIYSLRITSFRCHRQAELPGLSRINLLLGKNNSGKSAVLEALLFLALPANPRDVMVRLNELRGYGPGADQDEIMESLFYNWDRTQEVIIEAADVAGAFPPKTKDTPGWRELRIKATFGAKRENGPGGVIDSASLVGATQGLAFQYRSPVTSVGRTVTDLTPKASRRTLTDLEDTSAVVYIPARAVPDAQTVAQSFSRLEIARQHEPVVEALRVIEPRLRRLTVVATRGGSVLYGDLGAQHLMPVPLMGDGMIRVLSIALALAGSQNGLVLLDEVENGLHHSALPGVWRMIAQTARRLNVQVFAATHSDECIRALHNAVVSLDAREDLRLYRFDLTERGTRVVDYTADELAAAIESEQEIR